MNAEESAKEASLAEGEDHGDSFDFQPTKLAPVIEEEQEDKCQDEDKDKEADGDSDPWQEDLQRDLLRESLEETFEIVSEDEVEEARTVEDLDSLRRLAKQKESLAIQVGKKHIRSITKKY